MSEAIPLVFSVVGYAMLGPLGGVLGGMLGNMMFPPEQPSQTLPNLGSQQIQTTLTGGVIPVILGTRKVAGNVIILGDPKPYTITHKAEGGKGGMMGGGPETKETRYKRSFLIAISEGPATINRVWKGNEEISVDDLVIYEGDGNTGLATVVGKEFAHYKHLCCAWFKNYELGNHPGLPQFTFEVSRIVRPSLLATGLLQEGNIGAIFNEKGGVFANLTATRPSYSCMWYNKNAYVIEGSILTKRNKYGRRDTSFGQA